MNIDRFVAQNQPAWRSLEELLARIEKSGPQALAAHELREFARLYRKAADDLAYARTFFTESKVTEFLNHLVGRTHPLLYVRRRQRLLLSVRSFFARDFPQTFRACRRTIIASAALFLLAALVGYLGTWENPSMARSVLPARIIQKVDAGEMWTGDVYSLLPGNYLSAHIATNNITVTFVLFALGMTAGLGTVYILGYNGFLFGCAAGLCHSAGLDGPFVSFVAAHGPLELLVIFIAAGAGLQLSLALVAPGQWSRGEALRQRGARAVKLIVGGVPLLVIAGLAEGFVSGSPPWWPVGGFDVAKIATGALLFAAIMAYLVLEGRGSGAGKQLNR